VAAVPVAAVTALVAVTSGGGATARTLAVEVGTAEVSAVRAAWPAAAAARAAGAVGAPRAATEVPVGAAPAATSPRAGVAVPSRTEVRVPAVVGSDVVDGGGVYAERRHEDESFAESVVRCLGNVDVADPTADPCA
jgi:hypothetical protein